MNKQSMWFLTLFSLILVLSVYYITMPNELLLSQNSDYTENTIKNADDDVKVTIKESEALVALRVSYEEEIKNNLNALEVIMTNSEKSIEEKNEAYEQIKYLTNIQGKEEKIENIIKESYNLDNFVKISNNSVEVILSKKEHDTTLANNIMKKVQEQFDTKMYVTVKFVSN